MPHAASGTHRHITHRIIGAAPLVYKERTIGLAGYRVDLIVDNFVIVEIKAVHRLEPIHKAQMLTYLRLLGAHVGLILNFNSVVLPDGIVSVSL